MPISTLAALHGQRYFRIPERFELMDCQPLLTAPLPARHRVELLLFGRAEHRRDIVAASQKRFQHRFAKILLADDRDSHCADACPEDFFGGRKRSCLFLCRDLSLGPAQHLTQESRRYAHRAGVTAPPRGRCRKFDRHADVVPFAPLRMVGFHVHLASAHVLVVHQILGRHDGAARHVQLVQNVHELALGVIRCELIEQPPHFVLVLAAIADLRVTGVSCQIRMTYVGADALRQAPPTRLPAPPRRYSRWLRPACTSTRFRVFRRRNSFRPPAFRSGPAVGTEYSDSSCRVRR